MCSLSCMFTLNFQKELKFLRWPCIFRQMGLVGPLVGGIVGGLGVTSASVASALWHRYSYARSASLLLCIWHFSVSVSLRQVIQVTTPWFIPKLLYCCTFSCSMYSDELFSTEVNSRASFGAGIKPPPHFKSLVFLPPIFLWFSILPSFVVVHLVPNVPLSPEEHFHLCNACPPFQALLHHFRQFIIIGLFSISLGLLVSIIVCFLHALRSCAVSSL